MLLLLIKANCRCVDWLVFPSSHYVLVWQNITLASLLLISSPLRILQRQKPHLCKSSLKPAVATYSSGLMSQLSDGLCRDPAEVRQCIPMVTCRLCYAWPHAGYMCPPVCPRPYHRSMGLLLQTRLLFRNFWWKSKDFTFVFDTDMALIAYGKNVVLWAQT